MAEILPSKVVTTLDVAQVEQAIRKELRVTRNSGNSGNSGSGLPFPKIPFLH
jgi:hypothetical protein